MLALPVGRIEHTKALLKSVNLSDFVVSQFDITHVDVLWKAFNAGGLGQGDRATLNMPS